MTDKIETQEDGALACDDNEAANQIFYKVESLAFEAMSFGTNSAPQAQEGQAESTTDFGADHEQTRPAAVTHIRHIITKYITEVIEEEAPLLVAKALASALAPDAPEQPPKKS